MAKRYRVRSGSIDVWVNADGYIHAFVKGLQSVDLYKQLPGPTASVLMEGDDEKFAVSYDVTKYFSPVQLPEADFSSPDFVWHQSSESYFVCEKNGYNLEVEQIDNEEWQYRVTEGLRNKKTQGICKSKMQAVGRCEGFCLLMMACGNKISDHIVPR